MKRLFSMLFALAVMLALFTACTSRSNADLAEPGETEAGTAEVAETPAPAAAPSPEPAAAESSETPQEAAKIYRDFFDGELLAEQDYSRPVAVMINNLIYAQPQCGVSQADIIYEVLAEGGITRMMAIFTHVSQVPNIGSVRSVRPYYAVLAKSYGAMLVHAGGSSDGLDKIAELGLDHMCGVLGPGDGAFYRDENRKSHGLEHSMFILGSSLAAEAKNLGYADALSPGYDNGLRFSDGAAPTDGEAAEKVQVCFGSGGGAKTTSFTYHADAGNYTAVQHGEDYIDGSTNQVLTFENILVLSAPTSAYDDDGRLNINLTGTGNGKFICGGKAVDISWKHNSDSQAFIYTLSNGEFLELLPGKTFIAIIPTSGGSVNLGGAE